MTNLTYTDLADMTKKQLTEIYNDKAAEPTTFKTKRDALEATAVLLGYSPETEEAAIDGVEIEDDEAAEQPVTIMEPTDNPVQVAGAKPSKDDPAILAQRAAKWGFGNNVAAYNLSRQLQSEYRKLQKQNDPRWKEVHAQFRSVNQNKKQKYGTAESAGNAN